MSATEIATALHEEYPMLWELAQEFDFAERLGGCLSPLAAEADAALREIWMARTNLVGEPPEQQ